MDRVLGSLLEAFFCGQRSPYFVTSDGTHTLFDYKEAICQIERSLVHHDYFPVLLVTADFKMDPQRPDDSNRDPPYIEFTDTEYNVDPIAASFPMFPGNIYSPLYGDLTRGVGGPALPAGLPTDALQNAQFQHATTATASQSPTPDHQGYYSNRGADISVEQGWTDAPGSLGPPLQERVDSASNGPNAAIANTHARLYDAGLHANRRQTACQTGQTSSSRDSPGLQCRWENCTSNNCFRREADLMRHIKTIHVSPSAYVCPDCGRPFGRKDHLDQHRRRRH